MSRHQTTRMLAHGLDAANPLAFLAGVGLLRTVALAEPDWNPRLSWGVVDGGIRPTLTLAAEVTEEQLLARLHEFLQSSIPAEALVRWDNLGVPLEAYREYALEAATSSGRTDRTWADFAAAFGSDGATTEDAKKRVVIEDTAFRTVSGAGHQHFLGTMRQVVAATTVDHLRRALLVPWDYADPMPNSTLRWDPADDARHALQWRNPSGDPARRVGGTMLGATRLAIEGLPLFTSVPGGTKGRLQTTGFQGTGRRNTFFTWPVWAGEIKVDTCRSLLALAELQQEKPDTARLVERGVVAVFRSQRITEGKYRNFTPARRVA